MSLRPWRIAALLAVAASVCIAILRPPTPGRSDVVIVLIDTLRPDHLGTYGYARPTSPAIDRIAKSGTVFDRAYTVSPWTNPSVSTLLTGLYPRELFGPVPPEGAFRQGLPHRVRTLASRFADAGYSTVALVDHPAIAEPLLGFLRGFGRVVRLSGPGGRIHEITAAPPGKVAEILRTEATPGRPQFVYVHLVQPHWPYSPVPPYAGMFGPGGPRETREEGDRQGHVNDYDAEIREADDCVGAIEEELRESGRWDRTWFVVLSDHGEGFWEHGLCDHANSYYDELLRVPLVVHAPAGGRLLPSRIATRTSTIDLPPTLLAMVGLPPAPELPGRNLFEPGALEEQRTLFAEDAALLLPDTGAVVEGATKWVKGKSDELFDLDADPGERSPLQGSLDERRRLAEILATHARRAEEHRRNPAPSRANLPPETIERLRALGYAL